MQTYFASHIEINEPVSNATNVDANSNRTFKGAFYWPATTWTVDGVPIEHVIVYTLKGEDQDCVADGILMGSALVNASSVSDLKGVNAGGITMCRIALPNI